MVARRLVEICDDETEPWQGQCGFKVDLSCDYSGNSWMER